jgi:hypothetical protein
MAKDISEGLTRFPERVKAYESLSLQERENFKDLAVNLYSSSRQMPIDLFDLMEEGKLGLKDSQGKTLLDNLSDLSKQKFAVNIDGNEIVQGAVNNIFKRSGGIMPGAELTDMNILYQKCIKNNPAEYIRLLSGLTGEKGEATLTGGQVLTRGDGSLPDNNLLNDAGRIFQTSLAKYMEKNHLGPDDVLNQIK